MLYNVQPVFGNLIATQQIKALSGTSAKGHLHWLYLFNNNAAGRFAMVFDKATIPVNGDIPLFMQSMAGTTSVPKELAFPPDGLLFTLGLWIATSSTSSPLTIAAADLIFTAGVS